MGRIRRDTITWMAMIDIAGCTRRTGVPQNGRVNESLEVYAWDGSVRVLARLLSASWV
jgi:hypothetical protein